MSGRSRAQYSMDTRKRNLVFASGVFVISCTIGLIYQTVSMSQLYFDYKTTTSIEIAVPDEINPLATSLCLNYIDILDYKRLNNMTGRRWSFLSQMTTKQNYADNLTVAEIFNFTPEPTSILSRAMFRTKASFNITTAVGDETNKYFNCSKYLYLDYMCYKFSQKNVTKHPFSFFAATPSTAGSIYALELKEGTTSRSDTIKLLNHEEDLLPFRSMRATPIIIRKYDHRTRKAEYNTFVYNMIRMDSRLLPPPYKTECMDYNQTGYESEEHCVQDCVKRRILKKYNKIPFSIIIQEPLDKQIVSYKDVSDRQKAAYILETDRVCKDVICKRKACWFSVTITDSMPSKGQNFSLLYLIPSHPSFFTTTHAKMDVVEFLTYIMGAVSMWTGLSLMTFEPRKVARYIRRRIKRHVDLLRDKRGSRKKGRSRKQRRDARRQATIKRPASFTE